MPIWAQIVVPIATAGGTLIITSIINYILSSPKRIKKKKEDAYQGLLNKLDEFKEDLDAKVESQNAKRAYMQKDVDLLKLGTQTMLRNDLKLRYEHWLSKGFAPIDAKDDLERMYQVYHNLGANGVMDAMREDFLNLPDERVKKNREKYNHSTKEIDDDKG